MGKLGFNYGGNYEDKDEPLLDVPDDSEFGEEEDPDAGYIG